MIVWDKLIVSFDNKSKQWGNCSQMKATRRPWLEMNAFEFKALPLIQTRNATSVVVLQQVQEVDANRVVFETGSSRARIVGWWRREHRQDRIQRAAEVGDPRDIWSGTWTESWVSSSFLLWKLSIADCKWIECWALDAREVSVQVHQVSRLWQWC